MANVPASTSRVRKLLLHAVMAAAPLAAVSTTHASEPLTLDAAPAAPVAAPPTVETEPPGASSRSLSLEPVIVTAGKRAEELQKIPSAVTAVGAGTIDAADVRTVRDAAFYAPNVVISEFTNRRLSFPFVRGIGSGRNAPAVTTYVDGVPQLSFATSNTELYDVRQVEFIRGPQGTLYGRNTLGGVINVTTNPPTNDLELFGRTTVGNYCYNDTYVGANVPVIKDVFTLRVAGGYMSRDGYTRNLVTGNDLDDKEAQYGRIAMRFAPRENLTLTLRLNAEHDVDGDYALADLGFIRRNPHRAQRDFEGGTTRDLGTSSLTLDYGVNDSLKLTSITAWQGWGSRDTTDLDTLPLDIVRRYNRERQYEFSQEFRATSAPVALAEGIKLSYVAGVFFFADDFRQRAYNDFSATGAAMVGAPGPFRTFENGDLHNHGVGAFAQGTLSIYRLDLIAGGRIDYERREADLATGTVFSPFNTPPLSTARSFDNALLKLAAAYHWTDDLMSYASAAQGYKAGGFNTSAPAGKTSFGEEASWTYEVGKKMTFLDKRLTLNADLFYIDWQDLQLDVPTSSPGVFFVDNVGQAYSYGGELELAYRPVDELEIFTGVGVTRGKFQEYFPSPGTSYGGHRLPFAPDFTWNAGAQYTMKLDGDFRAWVRGEVQVIGQYAYDASGAANQDTYALSNFRVGVGRKNWRVEGWVRNAFDTNYVPLALPLPFAPSGYVGENGAPRTFGVTLSVDF